MAWWSTKSITVFSYKSMPDNFFCVNHLNKLSIQNQYFLNPPFSEMNNLVETNRPGNQASTLGKEDCWQRTDKEKERERERERGRVNRKRQNWFPTNVQFCRLHRQYASRGIGAWWPTTTCAQNVQMRYIHDNSSHKSFKNPRLDLTIVSLEIKHNEMVVHHARLR